jgi:hypothetical protein
VNTKLLRNVSIIAGMPAPSAFGFDRFSFDAEIGA